MKDSISVDPDEIAHFSKLAESWWDESGPFRPLHQMNPVRLGYLRDRITGHFSREKLASLPLTGLRIIDIGCGGGLVAEPMARLGATVTGIDATERNIAVAALHAQQIGLTIDYRATTAEGVAESGTQYDVVLALEIVEHVADLDAFMAAAAALVRPGGLLIISTLNRTAKSYLFAIVGAEYLLRWLPRGTHHWKKFLKPSEIARSLRAQKLNMEDLCGMVFDPLTSSWRLDPRALDVNYIITATKPE